MSTGAKQRLLKDFKRHDKEGPQHGILIKPMDDNIMKVEAILFGPEDTEWEGGVFRLKMEFSEEYPSKAPKVQFLTKMFHPNIYKTGAICLDILDKAWTPTFDCTTLLVCL